MIHIKKCFKPIIEVLVLVTLIFCCMNQTMAAPTSKGSKGTFEIISSLGSSWKKTGITNIAYSTGANISDRSPGIRITVVDRNGNRLNGTKTVDFYYGSSFGTKKQGIHYVGREYKTNAIKSAYTVDQVGYSKENYNISSLPDVNGFKAEIPGKQNPDFSQVEAYFSLLNQNFDTTMKQFANIATVSDKLAAASQTELGQIMQMLGYKFDNSKDLCEEGLGVYLIYEPIINVIIGNEYAWYHSGETKIALTQTTLKNVSELANVDGLNCRNTTKGYECFDLTEEKIDKLIKGKTSALYIYISNFLANVQNINVETVYNLYANENFKQLKDTIRSEGEYVVVSHDSDNVESNIYYALAMIMAMKDQKANAKKALEQRIYFTGTVTELAGFLNKKKFNSDYIAFATNGSIPPRLYMSNDIKYENEEKFSYTKASFTSTKLSDYLSTKGYGMNAIGVFGTNLCPKCEPITSIINGKKTTIGMILNGVEVTEMNNICCDFMIDKIVSYNTISEDDFNNYVYGSAWHTKYCKEPPPPPSEAYCSTDKINSKESPCCWNASLYSDTDRKTILNYDGIKKWLSNVAPTKYEICYPSTGCTYDIATICPNCNTGATEGKIYDEVNGLDAVSLYNDEDIKCIYENNDYLASDVVNNKYCKAYCVDDVTYNFPNDNFSVEAGRYITVGGNGPFSFAPISVENTRKCYVEKVNYEAFEEDLNNIKADIEKIWDAYQIAKLRWENFATIENSSVCDYMYNTDHYYACESETALSPVDAVQSSTPEKQIQIPATSAIKPSNIEYSICINENNKSGNSGCYFGTKDYDYCTPENIGGTWYFVCYNNETTYTCPKEYYNDFDKGQQPTPVNKMCTYYKCEVENYERYPQTYITEFKYDGKTYNKTKLICANDNRAYTKSELENDMNEKLREYKNAILEQNAIILAIKNCNSWYENVENEKFDPIVELTYQNDNTYSLDSSKLSYEQTLETTNDVILENTISYYNYYVYNEYDNENVNKKVSFQKIENNSSSNTNIIRNYFLDDNDSNIYFYIDKSSTQSFKKLEYSNSNLGTVYIGPHLPIAYDSTVENNKISLNLETLGKDNKFNSNINCEEYSCEFNVYRDLIKKDTGLNVVYRPISLANPFPSENGNGRNVGKNWCSNEDCTNTNDLVSDIILNNRGVEKDQIYFDKDPLYTIVLKPSDILEIRKYNQDNSYNDYNLECIEDKCYSTFLIGSKSGIDDTGFNALKKGILKQDESCALGYGTCSEGDVY